MFDIHNVYTQTIFKKTEYLIICEIVSLAIFRSACLYTNFKSPCILLADYTLTHYVLEMGLALNLHLLSQLCTSSVWI